MDSRQNSFVMVPSHVWEGIIAELKDIKEYIKKSKDPEGLGEYITEEQAKKLLGRKTTWFWGMRRDGLLTFSKVGNKVYYLKSDLLKLIHVIQ